MLLKNKQYLYTLALLVLASCRQEMVVIDATGKKRDVRILRAKWNDIPFPIAEEKLLSHVKITPTNDELGCAFCLSVERSLSDVIRFYCIELEREGWTQSSVLTFDNECILSFEKPSRLLTVYLHVDGSSIVSIKCFVHAKRGHARR